jgi:uncharacterized protein YcnI
MMSMNRRLLAHLGGGAVAAVVMLGAGAGQASAHVTVAAHEAVAGKATVLTISVGHGCAGSPTTRVAVQIPQGVNEVTPSLLYGWQVHKKVTKLSQPIFLDDGDQITQRVDQVVYTASSPLPDGYRAAFELAMVLPAGSAGKTLTFPTVQTCQQGEVAWTQLAQEGQDPEKLDAPAPSIEIAGAEAVALGGTHVTTAPATGDEPTSVDSRAAWGVAGLVAGLLGLACGSLALHRGRNAQ